MFVFFYPVNSEQDIQLYRLWKLQLDYLSSHTTCSLVSRTPSTVSFKEWSPELGDLSLNKNMNGLLLSGLD